MKKYILLMVLVGACELGAQSIKDLNFLIGDWKVNETILPGTDKSYTENGTRSCAYYLEDSFIRCESSTLSSKTGKHRSYTYLINYDKKEDCFWVTALSNDFPKHDKQQWFLDKKKTNSGHHSTQCLQ
ncbi:MAG: hypothetical protein KTR30_21080 [Saprospiraceae bacterium]|nr:hypothetical protein [Saprospiraceae bacterium]